MLLLGTALAAGAAPRIPASDAEVLEKLPGRPGDPAALELRRMRDALAAEPRNADAAARLARRYFDLAMAEGDPRYVGYAEAALRPWPESATTPVEDGSRAMKRISGSVPKTSRRLRRSEGR